MEDFTTDKDKINKRFILGKRLGLFGGTIGVLVALYIIFLGGVSATLSSPNAPKILILGVVTFILFALGMFGVKKIGEDLKLGGILMLLSSILGTAVEVFMMSTLQETFLMSAQVLLLANILLLGGGISALAKIAKKKKV